MKRKLIRVPCPRWSKHREEGQLLNQRAKMLLEDQCHFDYTQLTRSDISVVELAKTAPPKQQHNALMLEELELRYEVRDYLDKVEHERKEHIATRKQELIETRDNLVEKLEQMGFTQNLLDVLNVAMSHPSIIEHRKGMRQFNNALSSNIIQNRQAIERLETQLRRKLC